MAKLWKFLSVSIVLAVCLGLALVPGVPLSNNVVSASGNVTISIQPPITKVGFSEAFNLTVVVDNPSAMPIGNADVRLQFDPTYFNVIGMVNGDMPFNFGQTWDNTTGIIKSGPYVASGTNTSAISILLCTIECESKSANGVSTVDFLYATGPPPLKTEVFFGATHYLEDGNMSLMHDGAVKVGPPTLTVNVSPNGTGNVTINAVTPPSYPNTTTWSENESVALEAVNSVPNWTFVNWTGDLTGSDNTTNITMDWDKSVTAHFVTAGTTATLEGHVSFLGRGTAPDSKWIESFMVKGFEAGNLSNVLWTDNATTDNTGVFIIAGLTPGTYDIGIKNSTCLCKLEPNVTLTAGNTTVVDFGTMREGDCNDDNWVTLEDRSLLYAGWDTTNVIQGGHYCDLNRDGWLTLEDRSLMYANWDQGGD